MTEPGPGAGSKSDLLWYLALFLCLVAFAGYYLLTSQFIDGLEKRGQFGDAFGGLTALVTSLAFVGLLWTISLQRRDIEIQRKELRLSRKVLKQQRAVLADQRDLQRLQAFESTFFALLESFDRIMNSTSIPGGGGGDGRDELANRFSAYKGHIRARDAELKTPPNSLTLQDQDRIDCFRMAFDGAQFDPSRIFQILQRILVFIKAPPATKSTEFYAEILSAHMGLAEKWFVYMWPNSKPNYEELVQLVRESQVLKSMPSYMEGIQIRLDSSPFPEQRN